MKPYGIGQQTKKEGLFVNFRFVDVKSVLEGYYDTLYEIESVFSDPALEANETVTSIDDTSNKKINTSKFIETVEKIIHTLNGIVQRYGEKLGNFIKRVAQTDVGFDKHCRIAIRDNKPLEAVKLIAYDYDIATLKKEIDKISAIVFKTINTLRVDPNRDENTDTENAEENQDIVLKVLEEAGVPKDVTNVNTYFLWLKNQYRRAKKEILFKASATNDYYKITREFKSIESDSRSRQQKLFQQINPIKTNLEKIVRHPSVQDHVKRQAIQRTKQCTKLFNFYISVLDIYSQMQIERVIMYRSVLKKIYHFS